MRLLPAAVASGPDPLAGPLLRRFRAAQQQARPGARGLGRNGPGRRDRRRRRAAGRAGGPGDRQAARLLLEPDAAVALHRHLRHARPEVAGAPAGHLSRLVAAHLRGLRRPLLAGHAPYHRDPGVAGGRLPGRPGGRPAQFQPRRLPVGQHVLRPRPRGPGGDRLAGLRRRQPPDRRGLLHGGQPARRAAPQHRDRGGGGVPRGPAPGGRGGLRPPGSAGGSTGAP